MSNPLVGADRVEGTAVNDPNGVKIGTIERIMIDKITGQVCYAVLNFGGFLGIGERRHPLPWNILDYDKGQEAFVVNIDPDKLKGGPTHAPGEPIDFDDRTWGQELHHYYGTRPYWLDPTVPKPPL